MNAFLHDETPAGACITEPERWTTTADDEEKVICRSCPRRWVCAWDACELPRAEGLWARNIRTRGGTWTDVCSAATQVIGRAQRLPVAATPRLLRRERLTPSPSAACSRGVGGGQS